MEKTSGKRPKLWENAIVIEDGKISKQGTHAEDIAEELKDGASLTDIAENHPDEFMRYSVGIEKMAKLLKPKIKIAIDNIKLEKWETDIIDYLHGPKPRRTIYWISDPNGSHGKTTFIKYIFNAFDSVAMFTNGKSADLAHAWNGEQIVLFNLVKSAESHINYEAIESIKDGLIFSPKYDSKTKIYDTPYVIVFSNGPPDFTKLISNRWHVVDISEYPQHI